MTVDPSTATADDNATVECPYCGSTDTEREHPKGPSLCRSMYFCHGCEQPFEAMQ
jgi:transposase-like protein